MRQIAWIFIILSSFLGSNAFATPSSTISFKEGVDYQILAKDARQGFKPIPGKIQVIEFFNYGCPWCSRVDPALEKWLETKPKNVIFQRVPVVFNPQWQLLAKAYYTAEALGVEKKLTPIIFNTIHTEQQPLNNEADIEKLFIANGVSKDDFQSTFHFSPGIDAALSHGQDIMVQYKVFTVPTFIVNGQYRTDTAMSAGDVDRLMQILTYLVKQPQKP